MFRKSRQNSSDGLGLDTLWPPANVTDKDAIADIVFVHGLSGRRYGTWTKDNVLWPRELLAVDFPQARILTWGYDADVMKFFGPTGQGNLRDHARELNRDLSRERFESHQISRPIIFVAHSLGGLVVKHALYLSHREAMKESCTANKRHRIAALKLATIGVLFAGTPHRGSDKQQWLAIVTRLAGFLQKDRSTELVKALRPGSQTLEFLQDDFKDILEDFAVYSLIEEVPYPKIGKIVEKYSAVIGWHDHEILIHADHNGMVKFASAADNNYQKFRGVIQEIIRDRINGDSSNKGIVEHPPNLGRARTSYSIRPPPAFEGFSTSDGRRAQSFGGTEQHHSQNFNCTRTQQFSDLCPERRFSQGSNSTSSLTMVGEDKSHASLVKATTLLEQGKFFLKRMDRNKPENLLAANEAFLKARDILLQTGNADTSDMLKTLHEIVNVRMEMSYNHGCNPEEKWEHLQAARAYSDDALAYSQKSTVEDATLAKLYRAILTGRETEVMAKRDRNYDVLGQKEKAAKAILKASKEFRKSNSLNKEEHAAWADRWYIRLIEKKS